MSEAEITERRRVTLKDIARETGYHMATVSRAMSGSPLIPDETRVRVLEAAERMGYKKDPMLQALAAYRKSVMPVHYHGTIGWIINDQHLDDGIYKWLKIAQEKIEKSAQQFGYKIDEFRMAGLSGRQMTRRLLARGIVGLLFPPMRVPGTVLNLDVQSFPSVKIGDTLLKPALNTVAPNHYENTRTMFKGLRELGYKKIGFWLPMEIDDRTNGAFSAAVWRMQQTLPAAERLTPVLADGFRERQFVQWLKQKAPDFIIGLPFPLNEWMQKADVKPIPVSFPANLPVDMPNLPTINEDWDMIYFSTLRLLDSMIRHGERGEPEAVRRILIKGKWNPGTLKKARPGRSS